MVNNLDNKSNPDGWKLGQMCFHGVGLMKISPLVVGNGSSLVGRDAVAVVLLLLGLVVREVGWI